MLSEIENDKIYYVGYSDGGSKDNTHYICMWSEDEKTTREWCDAVREKFGSNTVMLKLNGHMFKYYRSYFTEELKYDKIKKNK
jgi:hypothetical protein